MAATEPHAFQSALYTPHAPHASRHHARGHEEPRVRSILLSAGGRSAYSRNGSGEREAADHSASVPRPPSPSTSTSTRGTRAAKHAHSRTTGTRQEVDALPVEASSGSSTSREPKPAEARPSSSTSASIRLEEDLAAGSGEQEAFSTPGNHSAAVTRPPLSSSSTRGHRAAKHPHPSTTGTPQEADALPIEARSGLSTNREPEQAEARLSFPTSASIHLEEDLAAALASSPTPHSGRTPPLDAPAPAMPFSRPRMSLELPPQDPGAVGLLFEDHKLALEGTSPKPCIVPGNALHLIDDDPAAPRSQTPPSVIIVTEDGEEEDDDEDVEGRRTSSQPPVRPTGPRVRFRSRVRITSGVHRHRHSMTVNGTPTPCSSASDSPSSSISAPLRYQADENGAWGPLGKRLSAYAAGNGWQRRAQGPTHTQRVQDVPVIGPAPGGRARGGKTARSHHERTPLLRPGRQRSYTEEEEEETQTEEELGPEERALRTAALRREEEAVFGKWPWRIFNRHWWWWHVEPVLCCCSDDSDYEEF